MSIPTLQDHAKITGCEGKIPVGGRRSVPEVRLCAIYQADVLSFLTPGEVQQCRSVSLAYDHTISRHNGSLPRQLIDLVHIDCIDEETVSDLVEAICQPTGSHHIARSVQGNHWEGPLPGEQAPAVGQDAGGQSVPLSCASPAFRREARRAEDRLQR